MAEETKPADANLVDQYDIGADVQPAPVAASPASPTPPNEPVSEPARDPKTGRFQKPLWLVQKARDFGMSQEEIEETPSNDLRQFVQDARVAQLEQRFQTDMRNAQAVRPPVQEPPQPLDLGIDESQYDPGLIGLIKKQAERIQQLEAQQQNTHRFVQSQAEETKHGRIDQAIDSLGMEKVFGKGRPAQGTSELARRKAIVAEAVSDAGPNASFDHVLAKLEPAAKRIFGMVQQADPPKTANGAPRITPEQWANGGLATATHRSGSAELPGKSKAIKAVEEYIRLNQAPQEAGSELDGLLGE